MWDDEDEYEDEETMFLNELRETSTEEYRAKREQEEAEARERYERQSMLELYSCFNFPDDIF